MTATATALPRIRLRPHQSRAVQAAHTALRRADRASVVMACGTGKTYVAARTAARVAPQGTRLVLLPTLELLAQTIDDWRTAGMSGPVLAVCSKRPSTQGGPVAFTTDPAVLAATVRRNPVGLTVFATYHSLHRVQDAHHRFALPAWSLIAIDEAHRTSGDVGKRWAAVHDDDLIPAYKRLYLTATPRIWSAGEPGDPGDDGDDSLVASMDNPALYGTTCFHLPLAEAIDLDLLADYRVVVMEVNEATIRTRLALSDQATEGDLRRAALQIAVLRAMAELDLRRVVSFHHRVADAHAFAATLPETAALLHALDESGTSCPDPGELWAAALDSTMDPAHRRELLDRFDGRPAGPVEPAHRTVIANARLLGEGEGAVGSWRSGGPQLTDEFAAFAGLLGVKFLLCKPRDPEAKGLVERANGYLETSFLPGRVFTSPADFNIQLADWLTRANRRIHRTLQARPTDRLEADRSRMLALPPIAPPGWWKASLWLPRDHYVRLDTCDYSVHPLAVGRRIEVAADLDQVLVTCDGVEVARHARSWARHQTITDPDHAAAAAAARKKAAGAGMKPASVDVTEVEERSLDTYDRIFGVIDGGLSTGEGAA
ncbi:DEAD/DEAH box helicase family protein [Streptomyces longwoodensis]|uniref:Mu transposase domain-containing protein n=1 Tax=Streptomyces longwoodensis TaxID=68231 RepID=UPI0033BC3F85